MARSRNRNNKVHSNNQSKQQNNQYRKKLFRIAALFGADELLGTLSKQRINAVIATRIRPPKIRYDGSFPIKPKLLREMNNSLIEILNTHYIDYEDDPEAISLYDFTTTLFTLHSLFYEITKVKIDDDGTLEGAEKIVDFYFNNPTFDTMIELVLNWISLTYSSLTKGYYWIKKLEIDSYTEFRIRLQLMYTEAKKEQVSIQDKERPVYKIGMAEFHKGVIWRKFSSNLFSKKLNIKNDLEVYVQSHAIERLKQRLAPIYQGILLLYLYISVKEGCIRKINRNQYLLEYHFVEDKLGYFSLEIIDNKAIITTFLFITSDGTPEGNKLKHAAGLAKSDKQFCKIDQLDTFLEGDFSTSDELKVLFTEAGCDHLLALDHKKLKSMCMKDIECGSKNMDFISKFIQKNRDYLDNSEPE